VASSDGAAQSLYLDNAATAFITPLTHLTLTFKILIDKTEFKLK
jgi:hypothetical protein